MPEQRNRLHETVQAHQPYANIVGAYSALVMALFLIGGLIVQAAPLFLELYFCVFACAIVWRCYIIFKRFDEQAPDEAPKQGIIMASISYATMSVFIVIMSMLTMFDINERERDNKVKRILNEKLEAKLEIKEDKVWPARFVLTNISFIVGMFAILGSGIIVETSVRRIAQCAARHPDRWLLKGDEKRASELAAIPPPT